MRFFSTAAWLPLMLIAAAAGAVSASPSFLGPSGNILTPSAHIFEPKRCALSFHHQPGWNLISGSYTPKDYLEIGLTMQDPTRPGEFQMQAGINAQVLLAREGLRGPALSVGVHDIFHWVNEAPYKQTGYLVASKDLAPQWLKRPVRVSLGLGGGIYRNGFGAVAVPIRNGVTGLAEYDGTYINLGARAQLPRGFLLDLGTVGWKFNVGASFITGW